MEGFRRTWSRRGIKEEFGLHVPIMWSFGNVMLEERGAQIEDCPRESGYA
jgi:hypothetical protein